MSGIPKVPAGAKIAILLGAGASHGYTRNTGENPPRGSKLFSALRQNTLCPTWRESRIVSLFEASTNFETAMASLSRDYEEDLLLDDLTFELCAYLAQFSPNPDPGRPNFYFSLLNILIARGRVPNALLCSLNYDCILEETLLGLPISRTKNDKGEDVRRVHYVIDPAQCVLPFDKPKVLKIHGSINFGMPPDISVKGLSIACLPGPLGNSRLHAPIHLYPVGEALRVRYAVSKSDRFLPFICYYAPGKAPHYNVQLRILAEVWREWITEGCDAVILIGVDASVPDSHLWEPVLNSKTRVYYVGKDAGYLKAAPGGCHLIRGYFPEAIDALQEIL